MPGEFFDAEVAGERIFKIISQSITHIRILAALQEFTREDWTELKNLMTPTEYLEVVFVCRKYLKCENLPIPCDQQHRITEAEDQDTLATDIEISVAIRNLSKSKAATEFCARFPISTGVSLFLNNMEELSFYIKERISRTPEMEKMHIANLKTYYSENLEMNEKICKYQEKIDALENNHKLVIQAKEAEMIKHEIEIKRIKDQFKLEIEQKVLESEEQMLHDWKKSEFRQADLLQEIKTQSVFVETLLRDRIAKESELRKKRYKIESQLVSILEQYDTDIGDRQKQKEELMKQLEEGRLELEQLEERFNAQELEYFHLTTDRENYDLRKMNEKLIVIRRQIAARTIQRAFRKFIRHKYGKKKMKKLKGGKGGKGKKG